MAAVGERYTHVAEKRLEFEVVKVLDDAVVICRTTATYDPNSWPLGQTMHCELEQLVLIAPLTSTCSCYWSRHPLYCTCRK